MGEDGFESDADMLAEYARYAGNSGGKPARVGSTMPDGLGFFDLLGNIAEWTCSSPALDASTLRGLAVDDKTDHILRGGHFRSFPRQHGSWVDSDVSTSAEVDSTRGLRIARTVTPSLSDLVTRSEMLARRGEWEAAASALEQALRLQPNEQWYRRTVLMRLYLFLGNEDGFLAERRRVLEEYVDTLEPRIAHETGLVCLLYPASTKDQPVVARIAGIAARGEKRHQLRTLAMAHFRGRRFAEADKLFDRVLGNERHAGSSYGDVVGLFFDAMNLEALEQEDAARASFDLALASFERAVAGNARLASDPSESDYGTRWRDWIYCTTLEREARQVLGIE